ncbi:unnamed protein product [Paramecium sonneborni]|uniref:Uncharacterized protein n=1 Tax=Paramecium sonneborni TaxID=65129 RepID=A0A8S1QXV6_9CILI|nr:unnamed protein product [Paramecium sonneborni]
MQDNKICYTHQEIIKFICINQLCEDSDTPLCKSCLTNNQHQICQEQNQIITIDQFINKITTQIDKKVQQEQILLDNLKETKTQLIQFYEDVKEEFFQSKLNSIEIKQQAILLRIFRDPILLAQIKNNNFISSNYFQENIEVEKQPLSFTDIDKSLNEIKNVKISLQTNQNTLSSSQINQKNQSDINQKIQNKQNKETQKCKLLIQSQQFAKEEQVNENQTFNTNKDQFKNNQTYYQQNGRQQQEQQIKIQRINSDYQNYPIDSVQQPSIQNFRRLSQNQDLIVEQVNKPPLNKIQLKQKFGKKITSNPIEKIQAISQKELITYSVNMIYNFDIQDQKQPASVQNMQYPIIDLLIDNTKKILIHMENQVLLVSDKLQILDKIQKRIQKNHITIYSHDSNTSNLIYYYQEENQFIRYQMTNSKLTRSSQTPLQSSGGKLLSIKLIKRRTQKGGSSFLLLVAFTNGLIHEYEMFTMNKIKQYQFYQTEYSIIQLEDEYCFGISEKNLYLMKYSEGSTQKICTSKKNIIQCASYVNQQKNEYEILVLQQNNKVYKYTKNGDIINQRQARINNVTSLSCYVESNQPIFFVGFKDGQINCYDLN